MKTLTLLAIVAFSLVICSHARAAEPAAEGKRTLFHVVSIKFKPEATADQIKEVATAFAALKSKIPGVVTLAGGTDVSPEKRAKGFTLCFVLTFASEKDRDAYAVHPAHKAFGALLGPVMADVMVIDFWSQD
jgi:hypothetical protein